MKILLTTFSIALTILALLFVVQCRDSSKSRSDDAASHNQEAEDSRTNSDASSENNSNNTGNNNASSGTDSNNSAPSGGSSTGQQIIKLQLAIGMAIQEPGFNLAHWRRSFLEAVIWWNENLKQLGSPFLIEADSNVDTQYTCNKTTQNRVVILTVHEAVYCIGANKIKPRPDLEKKLVYLIYDVAKASDCGAGGEKLSYHKSASADFSCGTSQCDYADVNIASAIGHISKLAGNIYKMCNTIKFKPQGWQTDWMEIHKNLYLYPGTGFPYRTFPIYKKYSLNHCCYEGRKGKKLGWCSKVCRCDTEHTYYGIIEEVLCPSRAPSVSE